MSSLVKWKKSGLKSPLARARGLGSAGHGSHTWLSERVSSVAMVVLGLWLTGVLLTRHDMSYTEAMLWLSEPFNAVAMLAFVLVTLYHTYLGLRVVIEDYVHHEGMKWVKMITLQLVFWGLGIAGVFSILRIAL